MFTLIIIFAVVHGAGLLVLANALLDAPDGYQDADGYHLIDSQQIEE